MFFVSIPLVISSMCISERVPISTNLSFFNVFFFFIVPELSLPAATIITQSTEGPKGLSYKYFHEPLEAANQGVSFKEPTLKNVFKTPTQTTTHNPQNLKNGNQQTNLWSKLEEISLKRYLRIKEETIDDTSLKAENDVKYIKSKRKDNFRIARKKALPSGVSYYLLSKDKNPYYKLLKEVNISSNFNEAQQNLGDIRVWKKHISRRGHKHGNLVNFNRKEVKFQVIDGKRSLKNEEDIRNEIKERRKMTGEAEITIKPNDLMLYPSTTETPVPVLNSRVEMIKRFRREVADPDTISGACKPFVELTESQNFYSPGYPDNYPNQTDCVTVLQGKKFIF